MTPASGIDSGMEHSRARLLLHVRLTPWERTVAEALSRANQVNRWAAVDSFQSFIEETHPSVLNWGFLDFDHALRLFKLPTLARVVSSLARWMVHGPPHPGFDEGPNGKLPYLARLHGLVDGETGYELPPDQRLEIDVASYLPSAYLCMRDGRYDEQPIVAVRLRCRWRLVPVMACPILCHFGYVRYNDRGDAMSCPFCHTLEELRALALEVVP